MPRSYQQNCPIAKGLDVLGERWTLLILRELIGGARAAGVEISEERVLRFLQHDRRIESRAEAFGQRGFACTDRSFDRDVAELQRGTMISSRKTA